MPKTFDLPVTKGGRLITDLSLAQIGAYNYSEKINFRRVLDQEARREGYIDFSPLPAIANQGVFDATDDCLRLVELTRPNGERKVIGFSRTAVKAFNATTGAWDTIGSGYSASGVRWQVITCNGYLVANNAVDLPFSYRVEDAAVTPLYELREVGVVSVGRIEIYNSFLMLADLVEVQAELLQLYMRGWSTFTTDATQAKAANFSINNTTENQDEFDVTTAAATIVATLPASPPSGFYVWIEKVDAGAGSVITSPVIAVNPVTLANQFDRALIYWDAVAEEWISVTFPLGVIPADSMYGAVPSYITNHFPWAIINSEYGEPRQYAPAFSVLLTSATATIVLPFASTVFVANQTRVAVVGGGPLGGILGGQPDSPNGILVTAVSGRTLTLETSTDADISYPRVVTVLRFSDVSTLVGRYLIQGDNSKITSLLSLRDWLVIFRETGIYLGRYTGDPTSPFVFTPKYTGSNVPLWPDAIASIKGDYLLYPSRGGRMYRFDGISWPEIHEITDPSASLFFDGYDQTDEVYVVENPITKEWMWFYPDTTLCFDYDGDTLSEFDQEFDAAAAVIKPGSSDEWFILAIGRFIYTYGLAYGLVPIQTWLRDGVAVDGSLKFGLNSFGDQSNEKLLWNYTPIFSSQSPDAAVEIQINSAWNPNATPVALLAPVESLPTPAGRNFVPLAFQALYFQDEITCVVATDTDCRIAGRIFEMELVKAAGVTRSVN